MAINPAKTTKVSYMKIPIAGEIVYTNPNTGEIVKGIISSMESESASSFIQGLQDKEIRLTIRIPTKQDLGIKEITTLIENVKNDQKKEIDYENFGDLL